MYFSDSWSFLLELASDHPPRHARGLVPVDLSAEEDWGDIEPYNALKDEGGGPDRLGCTIGKPTMDEGGERVEILQIWEYKEDKPFNGKFSFFEPVSMHDFVRRLIDAGVAFHGQTKEDAEQLKKHYGV